MWMISNSWYSRTLLMIIAIEIANAHTLQSSLISFHLYHEEPTLSSHVLEYHLMYILLVLWGLFQPNVIFVASIICSPKILLWPSDSLTNNDHHESRIRFPRADLWEKSCKLMGEAFKSIHSTNECLKGFVIKFSDRKFEL